MAQYLEVPLDNCGAGCSSSSTTAITFTRTRISLDDGDYDGATYYWEIIAKNVNATTAYTVELRNGVTTNASIEIAANTSTITRFRSGSFAPVSGANNYDIYTPQTAAIDDVVIYVSRIIVQQTDPTKAKIQFPLCAAYVTTAGPNNQAIDIRGSTTYGQTNIQFYSYFKKNESAFAYIGNGNVWTFSVTIAGGTGDTAYASLFDSSGNQISDSEVSTTSTSPTLLSVDFSNTAVNFDNNDLIEIKLKVNPYVLIGCIIYQAYLYLDLNGLNKTEVYYRVGGGYFSSSAEIPNGRMYYDAAKFATQDAVYHVATGRETTSGTVSIGLREDADDSGTADSDLAGSDIVFAGATKERVRTAITLTDEKRYVMECELTSGDLYVHGEYIVIAVSGFAGTEGVSASVSPSLSPSVSPSLSPSASPSISPSASPSVSPSVSPSSSPSVGWEGYTRGDYTVLPTDDTNLENAYSAQDYLDVNAEDVAWVEQTGQGQNIIHQFKDWVGDNASCTLTWKGKCSKAPSDSMVYLQIYNRSGTPEWEMVDSDNASVADSDFTLTANIADLTDYKANNIIACRVYQAPVVE